MKTTQGHDNRFAQQEDVDDNNNNEDDVSRMNVAAPRGNKQRATGNERMMTTNK